MLNINMAAILFLTYFGLNSAGGGGKLFLALFTSRPQALLSFQCVQKITLVFFNTFIEGGNHGGFEYVCEAELVDQACYP